MKSQIYVITETLLEAVNYLKKQIQQQNVNEIIMISSTMVEAIESVYRSSQQSENEELKQSAEGVLKSFQALIESLNEGDLQTMQTTIQFSLEPNIRKLHKMTEQEEKSEILIGIYDDTYEPEQSYRKERLEALVKEAPRQNTSLVLFTSKDVDFDQEIIHGRVYKDGKFVDQDTRFPDVISNNFPKIYYAQSLEERRLREMIPFTSHTFGNKLSLPKKLLKNPQTADLFIPFIGVTSMRKVNEFFEKNNKAVLKPISSARGENIHFIERVNDKYKVSSGKDVLIVSYLVFKTWIEESIVPEHYILQKYVKTVTKKGEPFDFRAHMQKNEEGKWHLTKLYPRVGSAKGILSNISTGGYTMDIEPFLEQEYGTQAEAIHKRLIEKSFLIAKEIDKNYRMSVDEMGIDLAIDQNQHIWMHESNPGPQSKYHEEERAVHTIGYAKYLAKNKIFYSNEIQEETGFDNQFQAKGSPLTVVDWKEEKPVIGLFTTKTLDDAKLNQVSAYVAAYYNAYFYTFEASDIDLSMNVIRGNVYADGQWVEKIVPFPDVIYDRLRMRGLQPYNLFYEAFDFYGVPMTHTTEAGSIDKLTLYEQLSKYEQLQEHLIPFIKIETHENIEEGLRQYKNLILKPRRGSFAQGIIIIRTIEAGQYLWTVNDKDEELTTQQLKEKLRQLNASQYVAQKFIDSLTKEGQAFDLRFYTMKDVEKNEWTSIGNYVRIGYGRDTIKAMTMGGYQGRLEGFLKRNRPQFTKYKVQQLERFLAEVSSIYENETEGRFLDLAFDILIDEQSNFYLIELNSNRPGSYNMEIELASYAIKACLNILEKEQR